MLPELGQFALILALLLAAVQCVLPIVGAHIGNRALIASARPLALGQFVFVALAFALLTQAFVTQDFSVAYVAQHSNLALPWYYRFSAVWGGHEGSLLLWVMILSIWTLAVAALSRSLPDEFIARVLGVLGFVSLGFLLFTVLTSNPFARHVPALADGNDLNPVLQDFGLIVHPPMLYMGYVGFSVAFAFAIAALLGGSLDLRWVRWSRPWTNVAWGFLTLGIALGSWWAYYELGWGGWWFWDPVENASFMPWLVGTALIHSQAVTEKRGSFRAWTLLLAIFAFSLSLLGTFLVRSGVLTSVHSFASDPERGLFILAFLGATVGGSLLIYALRAPKVAGGEPFAGVSRETLLLVNNLMFAVAASMVLLGTLYPLIGEAFDLGRISVGPPYFGFMFVLLMLPVVLLLPFGPFVQWRRGDAAKAMRALRPALALAIVAGLAAWLLGGDIPLKGLAGIAGAIWVGAGILLYALARWRNAPAGRRYTPETLGMILAHFGIGVFVAGVLVTEATSVEKDLRLARGETATVGAYTFRFDGVEHTEGPNYRADQGTITVSRDGRDITVLHPQKRQYGRNTQIQTESAIDPGFTRDLYVALGEPLGDDGAWSVRIYHKPLIRWIWLGALLMMAGGFVAASDRRFRAGARAGTGNAEPALGKGQGTPGSGTPATSIPPHPSSTPGATA
ncbi:heme lyase CcmF/NrfE family subunit [Dokdonella sp.]|uniref:heme lyase CcmF/NrfE family subunit n=1 Tax=Dokdonella sp. TaxID=2291710 RepID=UPI0025C59FDA|nr:heme lyase CcmF/NrfE family subunit [Dokdonella sp.]MBX3692529.1 heme lyase CcmF/NrfE family subunit [Dokdonella sp.]MCW5569089.1 heme lyase CcmF/NrfE family subunit [Dokdonella sp.]